MFQHDILVEPFHLYITVPFEILLRLDSGHCAIFNLKNIRLLLDLLDITREPVGSRCMYVYYC